MTMTRLIPRNAWFDDLFDVRRDFDKMFNRMISAKPWDKMEELPMAGFNFLPTAESYIDKEKKLYVCKIALPGIEAKEVEIRMQGNLLTITGERKIEKKTKEVEYLYEEFAYGKFERVFEIPEGVNIEKLSAEFANGVLEIVAPVAEATLPRKIEIRTVPLTKQVAA